MAAAAPDANPSVPTAHDRLQEQGPRSLSDSELLTILLGPTGREVVGQLDLDVLGGHGVEGCHGTEHVHQVAGVEADLERQRDEFHPRRRAGPARREPSGGARVGLP